MDPRNRKIDPGFKELTATFRKCSRLFLMSCPWPLLKIVWKSIDLFPAMLLPDTNSPEKIENFPCIQGVMWNILKLFQIVPCTKSHQHRKFHEKPLRRFSVMLLTDRQTHKHTNEKAIRDCVLAKISKMMITRNIMTTTVMIEKIFKSA